ncbi:AarF/ABC1/UbiB kinase family protein [candidate division KSB1 bacterium]|nr:AarF/ABC1/UbiB kinase family protein [candidate division KSB1 bacterium]
MKIHRIHKGYRYLRRYRQIVAVLVKYGFAELLQQLNIHLQLRIRLSRRRKEPIDTVTAAERLRRALEELGPTFIKLGQLLSTRSFLLPPEFIEELSKLQDRVRPVAFDQIKIIIEQELGKPLDQLFSHIETKPLASASIAQAHKAVLPDGEKVVVKVQRPNILGLIQTDLAILNDLAVLIERYIEESRQYNPVDIVYELNRTTSRELDFTHEARNVEQFGRNFIDNPDIAVPTVYWSYCGRKIVTLELVEGIKISLINQLRQQQIDLGRIAHIGAQFILKQVFVDGFFHADPHPGNLFVTPEGKIAPVDFGIVGRLDSYLMDELSDLTLGVWMRDVDLIIRGFINLGAVDPEADIHPLRSDLSEFIQSYYGLSLIQFNMKELIEEAIKIFSRHRLRFPSNLLLLIKTAGTYEDLGRQLDPDFDFFKELEPFIKKIISRRMSPTKFAYESGKFLRDLIDLIKMLPREMELILKRIRKGHMAIELQHHGLEKLIQEMDRSFNRLSFSLIIASLMVASSLILVLDKGPLLFGFPLFGVVGYFLAGILGIGLIIAILKSGKL